MTRVVYDSAANVAPFSFAVTGTWTTQTDAKADGGSYLQTAVAASYIDITIAAASGITCVLLRCARGAGNTGRSGTGVNNAVVTVDGAAQADLWEQCIYTTNTGATYTLNGNTFDLPWYKSTYRPIYFASSTAAHTIRVARNLGTINVDSVEAYNAAGSVVSRMTALGTSHVFGTPVSTTYETDRWSKKVATVLGLTEDSYGSPSESFSVRNVSNTYASGWQRAETDGTGATATCTVTGGAVNGFSITAGGTLWSGPGSCVFTPTSGGRGAAAIFDFSGSALTGAANLMAAGTLYAAAPTVAIIPTWWGRTPAVACLMHGDNDFAVLNGAAPGGSTGNGWAMEMHVQRKRETFWRMNANSPLTVIVDVGLMPHNDVLDPTRRLWDGLGMLACADSSVRNTFFAPILDAVLSQNGGFAFLSADGTHANAAGHNIVAREILSAIGQRAPIRSAGGLGIGAGII